VTIVKLSISILDGHVIIKVLWKPAQESLPYIVELLPSMTAEAVSPAWFLQVQLANDTILPWLRNSKSPILNADDDNPARALDTANLSFRTSRSVGTSFARQLPVVPNLEVGAKAVSSHTAHARNEGLLGTQGFEHSGKTTFSFALSFSNQYAIVARVWSDEFETTVAIWYTLCTMGELRCTLIHCAHCAISWS
jgi:hypothetical protein